ncbi:MAG: DUF2946 domain-containing protein [Burkholderiales bacterium]|uniref:DUF2946 family protein n=1 Tax=Roseateles sp. TaxID=1971397 RepID=UPI000FA69330|nr:MAG: DUF2946 domain-containing protein [Burkholderiales bacterium]
MAARRKRWTCVPQSGCCPPTPDDATDNHAAVPGLQALAMNRRHVGLTVWLAVAAFVAAALAPAISHAVSLSRGMRWADLCFSTSAQTPIGAQSDPREDAELTRAFEHCAYCTLHLPVLPMPAAPGASVGQTHATTAPLRRDRRPTPAAPWPRAQPRAPPRS